jgi:hypothetical protein
LNPIEIKFRTGSELGRKKKDEEQNEEYILKIYQYAIILDTTMKK